MLIELIPAEYLPFFIAWLDWNFYCYKLSLLVCFCLIQLHYLFMEGLYTLGANRVIVFTEDRSMILLLVFVSVCLWSVYCAVRYGYAVG